MDSMETNRMGNAAESTTVTYQIEADDSEMSETGGSNPNMSRRSFLGAALGGAAAAVGMAGEAEAKTMRKDFDSADYKEGVERLMKAWYETREKEIRAKVLEMQALKDKGKDPAPYKQDIAVPDQYKNVLSSARVEIFFDKVEDGKFVYRVKFFVTEKSNKDVDCGTRTLKLVPSK